MTAKEDQIISNINSVCDYGENTESIKGENCPKE
jgi:hypothetical protein